MYNGSTYSTTPNSPNINFAKKLPTTPHQPKLLIKKNVQTARQINRWISFFRACSCASCAFVFLPPVREADACLDDCEDLAFCGDLAVDVERLAVVLLLVFDCEPLLYVLLFRCHGMHSFSFPSFSDYDRHFSKCNHPYGSPYPYTNRHTGIFMSV